MNGIIVIDKPKDFTSFDVVAVMRRLTNQKKIGHAGTLDPMATGVLPILIGKATKVQSILPDETKEYVAEFKLGIKSDTQDITGNIIEEKPCNIKKEDVKKVSDNFIGDIKQIPPMYSAVKQNGKRLYDLARQGIEVERRERSIKIYKLELISFLEKTQEAKILVGCSKGTYIRTLCVDIGDKLDCGAVLTSLRRTLACSFSIKDSITLDEAKRLASEKILFEKLIPVEKIFDCYPRVFVTEAQANRFINGGPLDINRLPLSNNIEDKKIFCIFETQSKDFLGLGFIDISSNEMKIYKTF